MDEQDGRDWGLEWDVGAPYQVRGDVILSKTRSFPLISCHLSRAVGWLVGVNGGELSGF